MSLVITSTKKMHPNHTTNELKGRMGMGKLVTKICVASAVITVVGLIYAIL